MNSYKKYVPNILTSLRILFVPIIVILGITNHYKILIGLAIITALTDCIDGILARRWNATSKLGANLDAIADKLLAIGLLLVLIIKNNSFFYVVLLECMIALLNLFFYLKKRVGASLLVGKFKTWIIFITIILGFVGLIIPWIDTFVNICIYITVFLQTITLICYILFWIKTSKQKKNDVDEYLEYYKIIEPIILHKEIQKRKDYPHHINESVYEHVLRVSYDCYRLGKRLRLDYQSLTIAALLHDFYEKPWQYNKEKKPFLKKHAFTHAKEAVINARKYFGKDIITDKIESIMITHMFPINKRIPRNKEAWLLTLIDKADSIDFILHPVVLYKIFRQKEYDKHKKSFVKRIRAKIARELKTEGK